MTNSWKRRSLRASPSRGMNSRSEARKKACRTTSVGQTFGFFLSSRNLSAGGEDLFVAADRQHRRLHELRDRRGRVVDLQLLHQERKTLLERLPDRLARAVADAPHLLLERADRLLARLVNELLFGVLGLALLGRVRAHPLVHLRLEIGRKRRVLVHPVLEIRREVNLAGADARKRIERFGRQRRRAVLYRARQTVFLARKA